MVRGSGGFVVFYSRITRAKWLYFQFLFCFFYSYTFAYPSQSDSLEFSPIVGVLEQLSEHDPKPTSVATYTSPEALELSPVQVASSPRQRLLEMTQSISIIKPAEWEGTSKSLADVVAEQTGIQTRRYGGTGSFQTISVRGVQGENLLVMMDGIPLNSAMGGAVDLGKINLETVSEIEIYKGITPAHFGGNSLGGVVNIKSKNAQNQKAMGLHTSIGAYGFQKHGISTNHDLNESVHIHAYLGLLQSKNDWEYWNRNRTPYNSNDDSIQKMVNAGVNAIDVRLQPLVSIGKTMDWATAITYSKMEKGLPAREGHVNPTARNVNSMLSMTSKWTPMEKQGIWNYHIVPEVGFVHEEDLTTWTSLDQDMSTAHSQIASNPNAIGSTLSDLYILYATIANNIRYQDFLNLDFIVLGRHSSITAVAKATGFPTGDWPGQSQELSLALDADVGPPITSKLIIGANAGSSLRTLRNQTDGGYNVLLGKSIPESDTLEYTWSLKGGVHAKFKNVATLFGNLSRHSDLPSLRQRYGTKGAVIANPELREETGFTWEIGTRTRLQDWYQIFAEVVYFNTTMENGIMFLPGGVLVKPTNLAASHIHGVEATLNMRPMSLLNVEIRNTWQRAENRAVANLYYGRRLPNEPDISLYFKTSVGPLKGWDLSYWADYKSVFYRDFGNIRRFPDEGKHTSSLLRILAETFDNSDISGVLFHNVQASWKAKKHLEVCFSIRNINGSSLAGGDPALYESGYEWTLYPANEWLLSLRYGF